MRFGLPARSPIRLLPTALSNGNTITVTQP
jgi:hypothetical protein